LFSTHGAFAHLRSTAFAFAWHRSATAAPSGGDLRRVAPHRSCRRPRPR